MKDRPLELPEETITNTPDENSRDELSLEYIDAHVSEVRHDFPLKTRIKGLLIEVDEGHRVPVEQTINILKECLVVIEQADENFKSIAGLCDDVDEAAEKVSSKLYQGRQA